MFLPLVFSRIASGDVIFWPFWGMPYFQKCLSVPVGQKITPPGSGGVIFWPTHSSDGGPGGVIFWPTLYIAVLGGVHFIYFS